MSIIARNNSKSQNNLTAQIDGTDTGLKAGLENALSGSEGAVFNHVGSWNGYVGSIPSVKLYGKIYKLNAVHGYKGLPRRTPVVVRAAQNYLAADFQ